MSEYGFELALCGTLEDEHLVARQLGAHVHGRRIIDIVVVEPGEAFDERANITDATIPSSAIESNAGPGRFRPVRTVMPDRRPDVRDRIVDRAEAIGFFEVERRGGDRHVRQVSRYPDGWFDRLIGIENKPDLTRPGNLANQLQMDVSLGLFEEVILATASHVTGAHRNRIPDEVGIWQFDPVTGRRDVLRDPEPLQTDAWGLEPIERNPGQTTIQTVDPAEKIRARRQIAERAYGKGWRTFEWPACAECNPRDGLTSALLPYCSAYDRIVNPAETCQDCPAFEPGTAPDIDRDGRRDARTPWVANPPGRQRRQVDLEWF